MLQRHQVHQQQYKANGGSKGGNLRPLSAPPRSQGGGGGGGGTAYGSDDAADVLSILNGVERWVATALSGKVWRTPKRSNLQVSMDVRIPWLYSESGVKGEGVVEMARA